MIIRNGVQPEAFYKGDDPIKAIYRGEDLVWQMTNRTIRAAAGDKHDDNDVPHQRG